MQAFHIKILALLAGLLLTLPGQPQDTAARTPRLQQRVDSIAREVDSLRALRDSLATETATAQPAADTLSGPLSWLADYLPTSFRPALEKIDQPDNFWGILLVPILAILLSWALRRGGRWLAGQTDRFRLVILGIIPFINTFLWVIAVGYLLYSFLGSDLGLWILVVTIVVGYAAKDALQDLLGGIWLLVERPYRIGDRISVEDYYGEVKDIGVRSTQLVTLDDSLVTVPNSAVLSGAVANANSGSRHCMVVIDLWLPIGTDVDLARQLAREALISSPYLNYDQPFFILVFDHFRENPATNLKLKAYVLDARYEKAFASDVTQAAKGALREAGLQ